MGRIVLLFMSFGFLFGCNSKEEYSDYKALPGYWSAEEIMHFELKEMDTISSYNMFLNIRNTNEFEYSNLILIVKMNFPNGKIITDTLEYQMAKPDGTWLGTGGSLKENKLWYRENIRFFEDGVYTLEIEQAMRNKASVEGVSRLEGVTDVGVSIEASNKQ